MATLTQLKYLVAVDRWRHFGKAAEACHVSQPTLSMQLQKFEEEYDVVFFDRSKQPILPTQEGETIIAQAKVVLREAEKLDDMCKNRSQEPMGEFRLALIPTVAPYLLPYFLSQFTQTFPKVELYIEELVTESIIEALENDRIDAAILATPLGQKSLVERPLFYAPFLLYLHRDHPLAKKSRISQSMLEPQDIWLLSEGHCLRNQVVEICSLRDQPEKFPNLRLESGSLETIVHLIERGSGYTLLPHLASQFIRPNNKALIKPLVRPIPSREVSLVYRRSQHKKLIIEALAQEIIQRIPAELPREKSKSLEVLGI